MSNVDAQVAVDTRLRRFRFSPFRTTVWLLASVFFMLPLIAGAKFALQNVNDTFSLSPITQIGSQNGLPGSIWLSARLAFVAVILELVLMIPTVVYVHLRVPGVRRVMDVITLLPIIIPPIVLVLGITYVTPLALRENVYLLALLYVILAMPFVYRALDNGLAALDLKTIVEASKSLGANMFRTVLRVVVPNMRGAIMFAVIFTVASVMSEFTMAVFLFPSTPTLPVWVYDFWQASPHVTTTVAMLSLICSWLLLTAIVFFSGPERRQNKRSQKS
jgi:putative spermidine/putrescine transport system permease protein